MKTFVKKRIQTNEVSYWDAIPKLTIKTFSSMTKKVKVKAGDEKSITVHAGRDLFGRLLIVAHGQKFRTFEPARVSAVSNQKIEKSVIKMTYRSSRKCGKVDYKHVVSNFIF